MPNRTILLALLASLALYPTLAQTTGSSPNPRAALHRFHQQLAAKCPAKHLEMLSPAALSDIDDTVLETLTAHQRRIVQASVTRSCRGIDMGATCGNVGFLQAAITLHKLNAYTSQVCAVKQTCIDYSICTDTR